MRHFFTILIVAVFAQIFPNYSSAQYTVLGLNAKSKTFKDYEVRGNYIFYNKYYKHHGDSIPKFKTIEKFDVFSITDSTGTEDIIYNPTDTIDYLSTEQMRSFLAGYKHARTNYVAPLPVKISSGIVGAGAGMLAIYGTPIPFIYAILLGVKSPEPPHNMVLPQNVIYPEYFNKGYQYHARKKKIAQSLIWGGVGFGVGFAAYALILPNL